MQAFSAYDENARRGAGPPRPGKWLSREGASLSPTRGVPSGSARPATIRGFGPGSILPFTDHIDDVGPCRTTFRPPGELPCVARTRRLLQLGPTGGGGRDAGRTSHEKQFVSRRAGSPPTRRRHPPEDGTLHRYRNLAPGSSAASSPSTRSRLISTPPPPEAVSALARPSE